MKAYQIKITIEDSSPSIWRRCVVPAGISFSQMSQVMNIVMGWEGYHLSAFYFRRANMWFEERVKESFWIDNNRYDSKEYIIDSLLETENQFTYIYDFGDDWQHSVKVEKIIRDYEQDYPEVLEFRGGTPHEDCGGIWGYYHMKEVLENPKVSNYDDILEWTGGEPDAGYDMKKANEQLRKLPLIRIRGKKELKSTLEEFGKFVLEQNIQGLIHKPENMRLKDILSDYKKWELVEICKIHHLQGYSKYNKERLAEFISREILSQEVMGRYFLYLDEEEIQFLDGGVEKAGGYVVEYPADETYLQTGGYCGSMGNLSCLIPKEVWEAYRKNCGPEWKEQYKETKSLLCHLNAAALLYGCVPLETVLSLYEKNTGQHKNELEVYAFCESIPDERKWFILRDSEVIYEDLDNRQLLSNLKKAQAGKEYYMPDVEEVMELGVKGGLPFDKNMRKLEKFLIHNLYEEEEDAAYYCWEVQHIIRMGRTMEDILDFLDMQGVDIKEQQLRRLTLLLQDVWNSTRMIVNCGYTPEEINGDKGGMHGNKEVGNIIEFPGNKPKKIYPNDSCPCGSGKKYKHCCGKKK